MTRMLLREFVEAMARRCDEQPERQNEAMTLRHVVSFHPVDGGGSCAGCATGPGVDDAERCVALCALMMQRFSGSVDWNLQWAVPPARINSPYGVQVSP